MTADISTELLFGKSYGNLDQQDFNEGMVDLNKNAGSMWHGTKHVPYYKKLMGVMMMAMGALGQIPPGMKAFLAFHQDNSSQILKIHSAHQDGTQEANAHPNLVEHILNSKLPEEEKSIPRIMQEGHTIVGAGLETVGHTLRIITFWIYSTPSILAKMRVELKANQNPSDSDPFNPKRLEQLPYLTAVIMEGIRFNPGIVGRQARIAPDRDLVYDSWGIPAGTPVGMTPWLVHHDEQLYPDATMFEPERWTDEDRRHRLERTYGPFGRGTRNCLGMHVAWAEMYMTIAMVVSRFDFEFVGTKASDIECATDQFTAGTKTNNGVKVIAKRVAV